MTGRQAFLHAWNGYRQHAWGFDDLEPISKRGKDWLGVGSTISDSLDTMWIMGLKDEFEAAKTWSASLPPSFPFFGGRGGRERHFL